MNPFNVSFGGAGLNISTSGFSSPGASGGFAVDLEEALGVAVTAAVRGAVVLVEAEESRRQENATKSFARALRERAAKKEAGAGQGGRQEEEEPSVFQGAGDVRPQCSSSFPHSRSRSCSSSSPLTTAGDAAVALAESRRGRGRSKSSSEGENFRNGHGGGVGMTSPVEGNPPYLQESFMASVNAGSQPVSSRPLSAGSEVGGERGWGMGGRGGHARRTERRHSSVCSFPADRHQFLLSSSSLSSPHAVSPPSVGASTSPPLGGGTTSRPSTALSGGVGGGVANGSSSTTASLQLPEHPLLRRTREVIVGYLQAYCDLVMEGQTGLGMSHCHSGGGRGRMGASSPESLGGSPSVLPSSMGGGIGGIGGSASTGEIPLAEEGNELCSPPIPRHAPTVGLSSNALQSPLLKQFSQPPMGGNLLSPLSGSSSGSGGMGSRSVKMSPMSPSFPPSAVSPSHLHHAHRSHSLAAPGKGEDTAREREATHCHPSQRPSDSGLTMGSAPLSTACAEAQQCRVSEGNGHVRLGGKEPPVRAATSSRPPSSNPMGAAFSFPHRLSSSSRLSGTTISPLVAPTADGIGCSATSLSSHGVPLSESATPHTSCSSLIPPFPSTSSSFQPIPVSDKVDEAAEKDGNDVEGEVISAHKNIFRRMTSPFVSVEQLPTLGSVLQDEAGSTTLGNGTEFLSISPAKHSMGIPNVRPISSSSCSSAAPTTAAAASDSEEEGAKPTEGLYLPPSLSSASNETPNPTVLSFPSSPKEQALVSGMESAPMPPFPSSPLSAPSISLCSPSHSFSQRASFTEDDGSSHRFSTSSYDALVPQASRAMSSRPRPTLPLPQNLPIPLLCGTASHFTPPRDYSPSPPTNTMNAGEMNTTFHGHSPILPSPGFHLPPPLTSSFHFSASPLTMRILKASEAPPFPPPATHSPTASSHATFSNSMATSLRSLERHSSSSSSSSRASSSSSFCSGSSCSTVSGSQSLPNSEVDESQQHHPNFNGSKGVKRMALSIYRKKEERKRRNEVKKGRGSRSQRKERGVEQMSCFPHAASKPKALPKRPRTTSSELYQSDSPCSSAFFSSFSDVSRLSNSPERFDESTKQLAQTKKKRRSSNQLTSGTFSNTANQSQLSHNLVQQQKSSSYSSVHPPPPLSRRPLRVRRHGHRIATSPLSMHKSSPHRVFGDPSVPPSSSSSSSFSPTHPCRHHGGSSPPRSYLWLVDFNEVSAIRGLPDTFVSVSLLCDSRPELTVVFFPFAGEKFTWNSFCFLTYSSAIFSRRPSSQHYGHPSRGLYGSSAMGSGDNNDAHGSGTQTMTNGAFTAAPSSPFTSTPGAITATTTGGGGLPSGMASSFLGTPSPSRGRKTSSLPPPSPPSHSRRRHSTSAAPSPSPPPSAGRAGGVVSPASRPFFRPNNSVGSSSVFAIPHAALGRSADTASRAVSTTDESEEDTSSDSTSEGNVPPVSGNKTPLPSAGPSTLPSPLPSFTPPGRVGGGGVVPIMREDLNSPLLLPSTTSSTPHRKATLESLRLHTDLNSSNSNMNSINNNNNKIPNSPQKNKGNSHESYGERSTSPQGFARSSSGALFAREWGTGSSHPSPFFASATSPHKGTSSSLLNIGGTLHGTQVLLNSSISGSVTSPGGWRPESSGGMAPLSAISLPHHFTPWWSGGEIFASIEDHGSYLNGSRLRRANTTCERSRGGGEVDGDNDEGSAGGHHGINASRSASLPPPFPVPSSCQTSVMAVVSPTTPSPSMVQHQGESHAQHAFAAPGGGGGGGQSPTRALDSPPPPSFFPATSGTPPVGQQRFPPSPAPPPPSGTHQNTLSIVTISTEMSSSGSLSGGQRHHTYPVHVPEVGSSTLQVNTILSQTYAAGFGSHSSDALDSFPTTSMSPPTRALILLGCVPPAPLLPTLPPSFFFHSLPLRQSFSISSGVSATTTTTQPASGEDNNSKGTIGDGRSSGQTTPGLGDGTNIAGIPASASPVPQEDASFCLSSVASHLLDRPEVEEVHFGYHPVVSLVHIAAGRADAALLTDVGRVGWHHLLGAALLVQEAGGYVKALTRPPSSRKGTSTSHGSAGGAAIQKTNIQAQEESGGEAEGDAGMAHILSTETEEECTGGKGRDWRALDQDGCPSPHLALHSTQHARGAKEKAEKNAADDKRGEGEGADSHGGSGAQAGSGARSGESPKKGGAANMGDTARVGQTSATEISKRTSIADSTDGGVPAVVVQLSPAGGRDGMKLRGRYGVDGRTPSPPWDEKSRPTREIVPPSFLAPFPPPPLSLPEKIFVPTTDRKENREQEQQSSPAAPPCPPPPTPPSPPPPPSPGSLKVVIISPKKVSNENIHCKRNILLHSTRNNKDTDEKEKEMVDAHPTLSRTRGLLGDSEEGWLSHFVRQEKAAMLAGRVPRTAKEQSSSPVAFSLPLPQGSSPPLPMRSPSPPHSSSPPSSASSLVSDGFSQGNALKVQEDHTVGAPEQMGDAPFRHHHRSPTLSPLPEEKDERSRGEKSSAKEEQGRGGPNNISGSDEEDMDPLISERVRRRGRVCSRSGSTGGPHHLEASSGGSPHPIFLPQRRLSGTELVGQEGEKKKSQIHESSGNTGSVEKYHWSGSDKDHLNFAMSMKTRVNTDGRLISNSSTSSPPILLETLKSGEGQKEKKWHREGKKEEREAERERDRVTGGEEEEGNNTGDHRRETRRLFRSRSTSSVSLQPSSSDNDYYSMTTNRRETMAAAMRTGEEPKENSAIGGVEGGTTTPPSSHSFLSPSLSASSPGVVGLPTHVGPPSAGGVSSPSVRLGRGSIISEEESGKKNFSAPPSGTPYLLPRGGQGGSNSSCSSSSCSSNSNSAYHIRSLHPPPPPVIPHDESKLQTKDRLYSLSFRLPSGVGGEGESSQSACSSASSSGARNGGGGEGDGCIGADRTSPKYNQASSLNYFPQKQFSIPSSASKGSSSSTLMLSPSNMVGPGVSGGGIPLGSSSSAGVVRHGGSRRKRISSPSYSEGGRLDESGKRAKKTTSRGIKGRSPSFTLQRPEDIYGIIATFNVQLAEAISHSFEKSYLQK